ncbi:MAG: thioesterase family protein [Deltaproteobacteria bacterium]|nr:thioesterase family protein [Deltaproteobacteria bacterium]
MPDQKKSFDKIRQILREMYEQKIPFNKVLGLKIESLKMEEVRVKFKMKDAFIGNYVHGILHGGVISAVLDTTGGLTASLGVLRKMAGQTPEKIGKSLTKIGTIDLRIDYLRPGKGNYFVATGSIMRAGRRVSVTCMELYNDQDVLIAVGTGTYIVG